jgi:hypothetical protein
MPNELRQVDLRKGYIEAMQSLQTGSYKASGDVIDYSLYDRIVLDFTTPRLQHIMFQAGVGQNSPAGVAKTLADTNVQGSQGIPVGSKLYINAIKVIYSAEENRTAAELQLIQQLLEQSSFNFRLSGKDTLGLWKMTEMMGAPVNAVITPAVAGDNEIPVSTGKYIGIFPLNLPLVLAQQVHFEVIINHWDAAATYTDLDADWITVSLNGILERLS